ncbi:Ca-activated chloride channel family protein [Methylobacterium phyllostachyos]|uniref:Ca-activated chloride channel family protein n=1 Tax=Methylobacterium phyllostachyos TaxID=582672 RepID=A0A1H0AIV0_9HYPH|nr:VWA domain-containing protein [Methylobacterium phyllostachyos]SDN32736.1 Ca-activated chloride channel family protein [Methylobacterium phyllostachyos]
MSAFLPAWLSALLSAFDLAAPWALLALPLPLLAARLIPAEPEGGSGALRVPGTLVGAGRSGADLAARGRRRAALTWTLWIALVVALSGPRLVMPATALPASGREIMIAMDLSGSMERRDFALDGETVTRLTAVKRVGTDFIRRRAGDRIGLVIFADQAYVAAAPSFDTAAVARALDEATIGISGRSTGIGDGLGLALRRLDPRDAGGDAASNPAGGKAAKAVILLSDGANNAGQTAPKDVADLAKELGIKVYTIALGPRDMADADGEQDVVDTETLRDMAQASGGEAFRVRTTDDLIKVADAIDRLEGGRALAPPLPLRRDLWPWPAALALLSAAALLASRRGA